MALQHIIDCPPVLFDALLRGQAVVRDYVRGVAIYYHTGLYPHGRPGTVKTHTVWGVLEAEMGEIYIYHHGHLAPSDCLS